MDASVKEISLNLISKKLRECSNILSKMEPKTSLERLILRLGEFSCIYENELICFFMDEYDPKEHTGLHMRSRSGDLIYAKTDEMSGNAYVILKRDINKYVTAIYVGKTLDSYYDKKKKDKFFFYILGDTGVSFWEELKSLEDVENFT